jgi:hypothetical protein
MVTLRFWHSSGDDLDIAVMRAPPLQLQRQTFKWIPTDLPRQIRVFWNNLTNAKRLGWALVLPLVDQRAYTDVWRTASSPYTS